jgi:hypothetical protein
MAAALADFLVDFGARPRSGGPRAVEPATPAPPAPVVPAVDMDRLIAEAVANAEAEVAARFQAEMELRQQEANESHQAELELVRSQTGVELGRRLAAGLAEIERKAIDITGATVARILKQIATDVVAERAVAALASTIRAVIDDAETIRIRVKGPQSLFLPLTAAMGDQSRHLDFAEVDAVDLTATIDETLFETRIAEWSAALAENIP